MSGGKTIEVLSAERKDICVQQTWRVGDGEGRTGEREDTIFDSILHFFILH